ncbi:partner and localizer of BRCA2 [Clinocottus analis]|uniref:partner and localizer of BRCA2 n=1 Tax=Clinocottus analis TaxID=304258 RepID=UPI0035C019CD
MDPSMVPLSCEHNGGQSGDSMQCEEQLRTTLHCDDKEKLRRKLALLQREYLRTAERLQRAERLDAVRSRISRQDRDRRDPEVTSKPEVRPSLLIPNTIGGTSPSVPQCQEAPADSDAFRRSQVIRLLLPSNAASPQTLDPSHDQARSPRPSPALRLRSRRSRLRWERRSAEAGSSTADNSEERREQSEGMETSGTEGSEDRVKTEERKLVNESEELFSCDDSESPSLLLAHGNTSGQNETGDDNGNEKRGPQELEEKNAELTCSNAAIHTGEREQKGAKNVTGTETEGEEEDGNSRKQRDGRPYEDSSNKDTEKNTEEQMESEKSHIDTAEIKEEKSELVGGARDVKGVSLLDSCTIVEGLLYPPEYYVRTTRRMTLSQSQPDMQAVTLSQLSMGHRRRSRGRGSNRLTHGRERPDGDTPTGLSSPTSASAGPLMESRSADASAEPNSRSSSEISACQIVTEGCSSPAVAAARPARGRRKRRGRGRGRPQTPRCPLSLDTPGQVGLGRTSGDSQSTSSSVSSASPSLHEADGPKLCVTPGEAVPVLDDAEPASTATQPSSGGNAAQQSSASGQLKPVFSIFLKRTNGCRQTRSAANWQSLLLPSPPPAPAPLLPLPSLFPGPLLNHLVNCDITQDFHLPDDQFASLKLRKLRQVAVDSGVEHFTPPSYNTRGCNRRYDTRRRRSGPVMPLSLTPTISNSPNPTEAKQAAARSEDLQNVSIEYKLVDKLARQRSTEETPQLDITEIPREQQIENLYPACQTRTPSTESASAVQDCAADCVDQYEERDTVSVDHPVKPPLQFDSANRPAGKESNHELQIKEPPVLSSEERTDCPVLVHALEDQTSRNYRTEDTSIVRTLSFDCLRQKSPEEPPNSCTAARLCNGSGAPGESPEQRLRVKSPAEDSKDNSEPAASPPTDGSVANHAHVRHRVPSQLLQSPPLASAPYPLVAPNLPSSALLSSPTLPSLGLSPHPLRAALPPSSSPAAPALALSPAARASSPPELSPRPPSAPSRPAASPAAQIKAPSEPPCTDDRSRRVEPPSCPTRSSVRAQGSGGPVETAEEHMMRCTHTLKAPAGGCLVDACCLRGSSGALCVAAAGAWAVCLWSQTSAADWTLTHTWAFDKPVINVFPVPNAAGLMCVTLGQLEIREVRMLSCSSLSQALLCEGVVQAVVGVSRSRVVTSSHSASGSTLRVFTPSDSGRTSSSQPLVSPGVCVGALAPVDALLDALIGSSECGHLFVWNLKTGQLLRRIILRDGLSHTACLRGFSSCGALFVLLQHQLLSSPEDKATEEEEDTKKAALFSLVAVNPVSGKTALASRLHAPKAWSGRLCEADVSSSSVVGLSQSGCVCVWDLGRRGTSRTAVRAPDGEGWQLARWGEGGTLLTGHHNGDVTLHCRSPGRTSLCGWTQ